MFTTRRGGVSTGPYASLNLGFATDDDPGAMACNRAALPELIGSPPPRFIHQVHGREVRRLALAVSADAVSADAVSADAASADAASADAASADAASADAVSADGARPQVDGQATNLAGVALVALSADCLTIAVAGRGAVAMVHAGWRGLRAGVIAEGVAAVRELGGAGELAAAIGPGAGPCCYEVGDAVHAAFADYGSHAGQGRTLDLKAIAAQQLRRAGVPIVHDIGLCTLCSPELLFSHRRDGGVTGRQAGVAWLS